MKPYRNDITILNIILLFYPIEQFEAVSIDNVLGSFSPFRIVILPLCILYLLMNLKRSGKITKNYIVPIRLYFIFCILGVLTTGNTTTFFSFIGNIIQFFFAYVLFSRNNISRSCLFIITTWTLFQIPALIDDISTGSIGMANRFKGFFFDPNYLCAYCIPSFIAAVTLIGQEEKFITKSYLYTILISSLTFVFLSYSRGGMITLLFVVFLYLLIKNKRLLVGICIFFIPVTSYMLVRSKFLTWADGADNIIDGFIYRTFTLSEDVNDLTAGRANYFNVFLENIDSYMFWGMDLHTYFDHFNQGHFIHNGVAELLIQSGVIVGLIYVFFFILANIATCIRIFRSKVIPIEYFIFASSLLCLTALSYSSKYAWLCMGGLFALTNRKNIVNGHYNL